MRYLIDIGGIGSVCEKGPDTGSGGGNTAAKKANWYIDSFLQVAPSFKAAKMKNAPKPWDDGTIQHRLADVVLQCGKTGGTVTGVGVVLRIYAANHPTKANKREFLAQFPTRSIGPIRHAIFDVSESAGASEALDEMGQKIVGYWAEWQKQRAAQGIATNAASLTASNAAVEASDAMLKDMGLNF